MTAVESALSYAARGWPVFPVHGLRDGRCTCGRYPCGDGNRNAGKHPRTGRGCLDATLDAGGIERWWAAYPDSNVGIATGRRLAVIDIDPQHGGEDSFEGLLRSLGPLPDTCEVLTGGGGRHLYLAVPEGVSVRCSAGQLGPGVDVRGEGGYVVAPPSGHVSGRSYEWEASGDPDDGVALGLVPEAWLAAMGRPRPRLVQGGASEPEAFPEGRRNDGLFRLGRSLRAKGLSSAAVLAALEAENEARCVPPLDGDEVRRIAESACRVAPGQSPGYEPRERASAVAPAPADDAPPPADPGTDTATGGSWVDELKRKTNGEIGATFANVCAILRNAPEYATLRWNRMRLVPELEGVAVDDAKSGAIREAIELRWGFSPAADNLRQAIITVSHERQYHPVERWLETLPPWDGTERIDRIATEILHVESEDPDRVTLAQTQVHATLTGAVARVFVPGCKVDTALILVGKQGWYKSTFFHVLCGGEWFSDSPIDIENKDALLQLHDTWIYEWPEIETITSQKHAGKVKAFVASQVDLFRAPYGAAVQRIPRTNIIVGTTNEPRFLEDSTGSRRFWVLTLSGPADIALLTEWRDQLWAEALHRYRAGEQWHLPEAAEVIRREVAEDHRSADPWEPAVEAWLRTREETARPLTTGEVLRRALDIPAGQQHRGHEMRAAAVMRALGYEKRRTRAGAYLSELGREVVWGWMRECAE